MKWTAFSVCAVTRLNISKLDCISVYDNMLLPKQQQVENKHKWHWNLDFCCFCWVNCVFHLNSITTSNNSFLGDPALFKRSYVHMSLFITVSRPQHVFVPSVLQVVLLSATMPVEVLDVTTKFMREPVRILVKKRSSPLRVFVSSTSTLKKRYSPDNCLILGYFYAKR